MIDTATIERYMRDANPIPHIEDVDPDEFARFVAAADRRRAAITQAPIPHEATESHPTTPQQSWSRRAWAFAVAFILILASIGIAALVLRSDEAPVTDEPQAPPEIEQLNWTRVDDAAAFATGGYSWINSVTSGGPGLVAVGDGVWTSRDGYEWSFAMLGDPFEDEAQRRVFEPFEMRSVTATESGLYAVGWGGYGSLDPEGAYGITGMVWTSPDGTDWTAVTDLAVFLDAELFDIVEGGPGLVAAGYEYRDAPRGFKFRQAAAWISPDGATWTRADVPASDHGFIGGMTNGGPGIVAVGIAEGDAAVWTSGDGTVWSRVPHDEAVFGGVGHQAMSSVTVGGPGLVAVGDDHGRAAVWTSPDGYVWSRVPHDIDVFGVEVPPYWDAHSFDDYHFGDGPMRAVIATDSGLIAVGSQIVGVDPGSRAPGETVGDPLGQATVWTSPDGTTWSRLPYPESETMMRSVAEGGPGLIAVGSYEGQAAVWVAQP